MQVWVWRLGCSGLVALAELDEFDEVAAVDDPAAPPAGGLAPIPGQVWLVAEATADLVAEMLHDAHESASAAGREVRVDLNAVIARAEHATGHDRPAE